MNSDEIRPGEEKHLYRLSELKDFEVEDSDLDVRGWVVISADGNKFGKIEELIVDPDILRVRYLDVLVDEGVKGVDENRHMLIPIGVASLDTKEDKVYIKTVETVTLLKTPNYTGGVVSRDYERSVTTSLSDEEYDVDDKYFYEHDYFDDEKFYGGRREKRLYRLNDLDDYDLSSEDLDVRSWNVKTSDDKIMGRIKDLVVEYENLTVRYFEVGLESSEHVPGREKSVLIPIGITSIDESDKTVVVNLSKEEILILPTFDGGHITRKYEWTIRNGIEKAKGESSGAEKLYNHKYFESDRYDKVNKR